MAFVDLYKEEQAKKNILNDGDGGGIGNVDKRLTWRVAYGRLLLFQRQSNGAMVAAEDVGFNLRGVDVIR